MAFNYLCGSFQNFVLLNPQAVELALDGVAPFEEVCLDVVLGGLYVHKGELDDCPLVLVGRVSGQAGNHLLEMFDGLTLLRISSNLLATAERISMWIMKGFLPGFSSLGTLTFWGSEVGGGVLLGGVGYVTLALARAPFPTKLVGLDISFGCEVMRRGVGGV